MDSSKRSASLVSKSPVYEARQLETGLLLFAAHTERKRYFLKMLSSGFNDSILLYDIDSCQEQYYNYFMPRVTKYKLPPLDIGEETIGKRIARMRKKRGLTQIELARKIGISPKVVTA